MNPNNQVEKILIDALYGRAISKKEAVLLLSLQENSLEAALLRATANSISRRRFNNNALLLGQIGVDMAPCEGN